MDYNTLQQMFLNGSIANADLPTLQRCLQFLNGQPRHIDPRFEQWFATVTFLIGERQNAARHEATSRQSQQFHDETQGHLSKVSADVGHVKGEVKEIKSTLEKTHRIHFWILLLSALALLAAAIAAADVIIKWLSGK